MRLGNLKLIERWLEKKYAAANPLDYNEKAILAECLAAVKNTPTIDAEPVRHGQWRFDGAWRNEDGIVNDYFCSCCGRIISVDCKAELENYPYCHCGAKMDLKE